MIKDQDAVHNQHQKAAGSRCTDTALKCATAATLGLRCTAHFFCYCEKQWRRIETPRAAGAGSVTDGDGD